MPFLGGTKNMKNFKGFIMGALTVFLVMTLITTVFAASTSRTLTAIFRDIKITIDGQLIEPKDANGKVVEPFIIDGTTYLPVRAVAEAVGYDVSWDSNTNTVTLNKKTFPTTGTFTFGDTFIFDDLEITFGKEYQRTTVDNKYSEHYEKDVIKFPITIKNIKNETHNLNMFYYTLFNPAGNEADTLLMIFNDDILSAGKMRSGATQNTYIHVLYEGDGDYYAEFSKLFGGDTIEVRLPVKK